MAKNLKELKSVEELERAIVDHLSDSGFVPSPAESSPT